MNIQETIDSYYDIAAKIQAEYPNITNIRFEMKDIPFAILKLFAIENSIDINIPKDSGKPAFIIHHDYARSMDVDIWLYSTPVTIKPAEII